jgi:hypothetical protein
MRTWVLVAAASLLFFSSCSEPGGPEDVALDVLLTDDTLYAPGYSDEQFNAIRVGMTEAEVLDRLGPPIDEPYSPHYEGADWDKGMRWTKSAHDSHYKVRVIRFRAGRVSEKDAEFYVD